MSSPIIARARGGAGFSLLELLLALFIISFAVLGFYQLLRSSSSRAQMSGNTLTANRVGMKVVNDLQEDIRLNGDLLSVMDFHDELKTKNAVIDGNSPFFRHFHDSQAPWGTMDPAQDGKIGTPDGDLYPQLKPFEVEVAAERRKSASGNDPGKHLAEVVARVGWKEKDGQSREYALDALLPSPVGPKIMERLTMVDENTLEAEIVKAFFPDKAGGSLAVAAQSKGADPALVKALGRCHVATTNLLATVASAAAEINTLRNTRSTLTSKKPSVELVNLQGRIAASCEGVAALMFVVLQELVPTMREIEKSFKREKLGSLSYDTAVKGLAGFEAVTKAILPWVVQSRREYEWLMGEALLPVRSARRNEQVNIKALEGWRLSTALDGTNRVPYRAFVQSLIQRYQGRSPAWERLLARERKLADDPALLQQTFGNLNRIVKTYTGDLLPLAEVSGKIVLRKPL